MQNHYAKFNFMQVVHPKLKAFHCGRYLIIFKQIDNGPNILNEIQVNGKWTRTLSFLNLLKIEKLKQRLVLS